jgi:hypothetical protein
MIFKDISVLYKSLSYWIIGGMQSVFMLWFCTCHYKRKLASRRYREPGCTCRVSLGFHALVQLLPMVHGTDFISLCQVFSSAIWEHGQVKFNNVIHLLVHSNGSINYVYFLILFLFLSKVQALFDFSKYFTKIMVHVWCFSPFNTTLLIFYRVVCKYWKNYFEYPEYYILICSLNRINISLKNYYRLFPILDLFCFVVF